jgi:hypothetical protein
MEYQLDLASLLVKGLALVSTLVVHHGGVLVVTKTTSDWDATEASASVHPVWGDVPTLN